MKTEHAYDRFRLDVQPALISKKEEFFLLGYGTVSEDELWDFLKVKKWKKVQEDKKLYEIVSEILSIKVGEYMNYASVEAMKLEDFSLDNEEELKELLK